MIAASAVPIRNVGVDPYEIFGTGLVNRSIAPNEHFLKVEHVMRSSVPYDAYLVGASTSGVLDPEFAAQVFPGYQVKATAFRGLLRA